MKLVSVGEMQAIEREADAGGLTYARMMENAGKGVAEAALAAHSRTETGSALGLVGPGNNGGDALVALDHLAKQGWQVKAYLVAPRKAGDPLVERVTAAGGEALQAGDDPGFERLKSSIAGAMCVLDGVLGTGIRLPLKEEVANALLAARTAIREAKERPFVVAVDCPSGIDLDTGGAAPECIPADLTVTMAAVKMGLLRFPAFNYVGDLQVAGLGPVEHLKAWQAVRRSVPDEAMVRAMLPARPLDAHKGTFGTVMAAAGSINFTGAALLAGEAAYRSGAGLVTLAVPAPLHAALAGQFPEATWLLLPHDMGVISREAASVVRENLERVTAMLIGPGFGMEDTTRDFLSRLLGAAAASRRSRIGFNWEKEAEAPAAAGAPDDLPPLVFDADGLKLLARIEDWPRRLPPLAILTPHPGEMAVLTGLSKDEIQADRVGTAERFAAEWGHVVVLKGAFTVAAAPGGETAVIPVASPALARAGTGDVLSGLIAGLRAQGVEPFAAATAGAWIHAYAGLSAAEGVGNTASVLAGDVLNSIHDVMAALMQVRE